MSQDLARQRLRDAGFQVAEQATPVNSVSPAGAVVGSSPSGQTVPGSIITIQVSNGIPPPPPPPPPGMPPLDPNNPLAAIGSTVVQIPGLPPITVPVLGPPPPPPPP
jgi:beta-lactam-binding protein with PASTA domain